jgi:hypothetical protein
MNYRGQAENLFIVQGDYVRIGLPDGVLHELGIDLLQMPTHSGPQQREFVRARGRDFHQGLADGEWKRRVGLHFLEAMTRSHCHQLEPLAITIEAEHGERGDDLVQAAARFRARRR